MDILTEIEKMIKQSGFATAVAVTLIAIAFGVGVWFKHFTNHVDHPIEQAAEQVLERHGIDVDFSADKKKQ